MGLSHSPRIVTDGLVFCVDAANKRSYPSTNNEWNDLTPNGYNGQLINGASYSQEGNGSMLFDGTNDYISGVGSLGDVSLDLSDKFTISFWMNSNSQARSAGIINISTSNDDTALVIWQQPEFFGYIGCFARQTDNTNLYSSEGGDGSLPSNVWRYCTFVKNGNAASNLDWYFNNAEELGYRYRIYDSTPTTIREPDGSVFLGWSRNNAGGSSNQYYNGYLSNLSIYNRALTTAEIKSNYNATKWRFQ
jgi:hypothetical protein